MSHLISVIFSTYNSIPWLEKVLWGFEEQTDNHFEIIIADDGSNQDTANFIQQYKQNSSLKIKHVWHEDNGFQKCVILNKAIVETSGEYLIFTDGDCIPRKDFIQVHRQSAQPGYFLSGGYFKLPMSCSQAIQRQDIQNGNAFNIDWLISQGYPKKGKKRRLSAKGKMADFYNWLIPTAKTWNGHNASGWKQDLIKVNGFDERMQYGGEDCEMGDRLKHSGIQVKRVRYTAVCIHLDHARGYVNDEMKKRNKQIRNETIANKSTSTLFGISKTKQPIE